MDSEAVHSSHQVNENEQYQPQNGEEQQSDTEKKSVLNKVKAKAKKIKDTIKKHGQQVLDQYGRENSSNEDQNSPVGHRDMDIDEKNSQDQPVDESDKNAPPTYEQVENFVKSAAPESEQGKNSGNSAVDSGGKTLGEKLQQEPRDVDASPITSETNEDIATEQGKTLTVEEIPGILEKPKGFDEVTRTQGTDHQTKTSSDPSVTVDENEDVKTVPPSFEQVEKFVEKATPASEQVKNLDELGVNYGGTTTVKEGKPLEEPRVVGASPIMETDQNITTETAKTSFAGEEKKPGQGEINLERPKGFDEDMNKPERKYEAYTPQTKFTDPTRTGSDGIDITPVEKSFERMNVQDEPKSITEPKVLSDSGETQYPAAESQGQFMSEPDISSATKTQYPPSESPDHNIPELSSSSETQYSSERSNEQFVPEISNAKMETQYPSGGTHDKFASDTLSTISNSNKENPEETEQTVKPSKQNSYSDDKSSTASVIADKAVSAENVEASKLDYDEKDDRDNKVKTLEEEKSEDGSKNSGSKLEYGKNIASSVTQKLAPVYGKVTEVGSAVKSKVSGTRTSEGVGVEAENVGKEQDKGVSVKDYLAEKLKPGEEDKALSEVISQTLYKRKEEPKKTSEDEDRDVTKVGDSSDAVKKQEIEAVEKEHGKSEESNVNSPGKSVVGKIKGVVGSWFGKSDENQSSPVAGGEVLPKDKNTGEVEQVEGERRLKE